MRSCRQAAGVVRPIGDGQTQWGITIVDTVQEERGAADATTQVLSIKDANPDLTVVYTSGQAHEIPVGSTAVRQIIEEYQPLLALHGHIHESRGEARIGRTLAINSGSEYNSGRIHGVTVTLGGDRVLAYQFVIG